MTEFVYLTQKEVEEVISKMSEDKKKDLLETMRAFRRQHKKEQFVSGWSKKYKELEEKEQEKIRETFGFYLDYPSKETAWNILSDEFIYNQ